MILQKHPLAVPRVCDLPIPINPSRETFVLAPLLAPMPTPFVTSSPRVRACFILAGALTSQLSAQSVPPPAAPSEPTTPEPEVLLSPFVVSTETDTGYAATNTLAGTRLKSALANTPAPLSILTREFINDIGATDANQAITYVMNAGVDTNDVTGNTQAFSAYSFSIRGFSGATVARNYFGSNYLSDAYNIDSYEVARGPNAVLFGIASPAGVFNSSTKIARPGQTLTELQLRVGSFNDFRGTMDISRTLGAKKNMAVRVNLLSQNADGYYDFQKTERNAGTLSATWSPTRSTTIRVEGELARFFSASPRPFPISDGISQWAAAGSVLHTDPTSRPALTGALASVSGSGVIYYPESPIGNHPFALSGNFLRTSAPTPIRGGTGTDFPGILDPSVAPRTINLLGPSNGNQSDQAVLGVFVEQRVGRNVAFEAAWYHQGRDYLSRQPMVFNDNILMREVSTNIAVFDPNTGAQTGYASNPNVGRMLIRGQYGERETHDKSDNFRFTGSYDLDFTKRTDWVSWLGHHRVASLLQRTFTIGHTVSRQEVNRSSARALPDLTNTTNYITRANRVDLFSSNLSDRGMWDPRDTPINGILYGSPGVRVESGLANVNWTGTRSIVSSAVLATQSSFIKDRLWLTAGIRRDRVSNRNSTAVRDATSREYLGVGYQLPWAPSTYDTTKSVGGVFHLTSWLSVFANKSDNFALQASSLLFGEVGTNGFSKNTRGSGRDYGVRTKLWDSRVHLNFNYYETSQVGQFYSPQGAYASIPQLIWQALGESRQLTGGDVQDLDARGYEIELVANPTKNLRLTFNFSESREYGLNRQLAYEENYLNANRSVWLSPTNALRPVGGASTFGSNVQELWDYLQRQLVLDRENNGRMPFLFRPKNANAFARYQFSDGMLKGFAFGGGINWRGPMVLAYPNNDASRQMRGYEQILGNLLLSYSTRIRGKAVTFQLNGNNVFKFDDPFPRRYYWYGDAAGSSILYQFPAGYRTWVLTTTVRL